MNWPHGGAQVLGALVQQPHLLMLIALMLVAACIDWRTSRIPNWLTVGAAALALALSLAAVLPSAPGPWQTLAGLALGLGLMLPMYLLGVMGAGDVKLMAMVGAWLGPLPTLHAVLCVWVTGGLAALALVAARRAWVQLALNLQFLLASRGQPLAMSLGKLPYAVSIFLGTLLSLGWQLGQS